MKKRYLLILCLSVLSLLFSIVGAVWFSPIKIGNNWGKPTKNEKQVLAFVGNPPVLSKNVFYYGEEISVAQKSAIQDEQGNYVTQGEWTVYTNVKTSSTESTIPVKATVLFTPTELNKYEPVSTTVDATLIAVASYDGNYYSCIDGALEAANANNSGTVYSLPLGYTEDELAKTAKTITTTTEIKSGATLAVPYANDINGNPITNYSYVKAVHIPKDKKVEYTDGSLNNPNYLNNQVSLAENLTLTNNGTINIAGEISGGSAEMHKCTHDFCGDHDHANSITAGLHGQINLNKNAKIKSNGTIECYGFINETTQNNGSEVIFEKGTGTVVFSVIEHRGGSAYFGLIGPENSTVRKKIGEAALAGIGSTPGIYNYDSLQTAPFNRFYIESITAKTTVKYNATLKGHANLYANDNNNITTVNLVSNSDSKSLITLTKSTSYVATKYDHNTHVMDLDIYGDMKLNPMSLTLRVTKSASSITVTMDVTLGTQSIFFPISNYLDVSLNPINGSTTVDLTSQQVKVLPGGKLTVEQGVTVNAKSIAVYENNDLFTAGFDYHYITTTPGEFIMNGTLNVETLGGMVDTNNDNAVLNITGSNTVISKEIKSVLTGQSIAIPVTVIVTINIDMGYTGIEYFTDKECTLTAKGDTVSRDGAVLPAGEYKVLNGKWYSLTKVISYNANGGSFDTEPTPIKHNISGGYTIQQSDIPTAQPTREHYTFGGWTLNGENPIGQVTYVNAELIAKWIPINYSINYVINSDQIDISGITSTPTNSNPTTYNADSIIELVAPTWESFKFDGWYLDEGLTQRINTINGAVILDGIIGSHPITLYGEWLDPDMEIYEITYQLNNDDEAVQSVTPSSETVANTKIDSYSVPSFDKFNSDTTYKKAFLGWYIDETFTTLFDKATHLTSDITLYANWIAKYHFILNASEGDGANQKVTKKDVYITEAQIAKEANQHLSGLESNLKKDDNDIGVSKYFGGWTTTQNDTSQKVSSITTVNFTTQGDDGCLTCNVYAIWADKITVQLTNTADSYSLKVNGNSTTLTTLYVLSTDTIIASGTKGWGIQKKTVTIKFGTTTVKSITGGRFQSVTATTDAITASTYASNNQLTITIS